MNYRTPPKPDPGKALLTLAAVNPKRWFLSPVIAVIPLLVVGIAWLTADKGDFIRTLWWYFFFFAITWLVATMVTRITMMSESKSFVAFYPERLALFMGGEIQLIERANLESFERITARPDLYRPLAVLSDGPIAEHFRLRLQERGSLGFDHLGATTVEFRREIPVEVKDPDAFEAALAAWLGEASSTL